MRMLITVLMTVVTVATIVRPVTAADVDAAKVREAIGQAVKYLKAKQGPRGKWSGFLGNQGGTTALAALALINCGEDPKEEHLRKALAYLSTLRSRETYVVALQTMVLCAADPELYRTKIATNARWLEAQQIRTGSKKGAWSYGSERGGNGDPSNTQFALLALHEAQEAGVRIKRNTWQMALDYWLDMQSPGGGWKYYRDDRSDSGSMTCAGIASLVIASERLEEGDASVSGQDINCCGRAKTTKARDAIVRGTQWLAKHFTVYSNPGKGSFWFYYLYGVERVGRLTGQRFIGDKDWYRRGAAMFLKTRSLGRLSPYWKGKGPGENDPVIGTSLALLFLSKGQRPVLMAKLQHGTTDDWNRHRKDAANLTRYVEGKWKQRLTWQVINSQKAEVDDLLQTPVLYISGRDDLKLSTLQKKILRKYIDAGGFIFAENCCGGTGFDKAFRAFVEEMFPDSKLRLLPKSHPIWYAEERIDPDDLRPLWGIEACCRTSVVYCPENLSCHWELARSRSGDPYDAVVQKKVQAALSIGINVLAYATNRQLRDKLDVPTQTVDAPAAKSDRGTLYVVKLDHSGGGDEAPNALPNLLRAAGANLKLRINSKQRLISITDKQLFKYHIAFMHGRRSFRLSDQERVALKKFIERGGFLLVDSICASPEFTAAFRREMKLVFPNHELSPIPKSDAMFTRHYGGEDITTVTRREPQRRREKDARLDVKTRRVPPAMEGVRIDDRYGVIFSPYDMSCALENHESLECRGYGRRDAARIGLNMLLYALHQ